MNKPMSNNYFIVSYKMMRKLQNIGRFITINSKSSQQCNFRVHKVYGIAVELRLDRIEIREIKYYSFLSTVPYVSSIQRSGIKELYCYCIVLIFQIPVNSYCFVQSEQFIALRTITYQ